MPQVNSRLELLVADDNRDAADSLAQLFTIWGYSVRVAYDGLQALRMVGEQPADCVFLDIGMPGMNGCDVARKIRLEPALCEAKLVALTAFCDEGCVRRVWESGFDNYFKKPADPDLIKRELEMLEEFKQISRQNVDLPKENQDGAKEIGQKVKKVKQEVKGEAQVIQEEKNESAGTT